MRKCLRGLTMYGNRIHLRALAASLSLVAAVTIGARAELSGARLLISNDAKNSGPAGIFEGSGDVGTVKTPGSVEYDAAKQIYTISASGYNMWFEKDAFQFAWKKVSGDVTLTADISFLGKGVQEHRKAVLMIRQTLSACGSKSAASFSQCGSQTEAASSG